jgi:hypothetical protein
MIVLDEELQGLGLEQAISRWYRGAVIIVNKLRPGTVIKDESVPGVLRRAKQPTFVTINWSDFWRRIDANRSYCVVCFKLTADRTGELPDLLRQLFRTSGFRTKQERMGKVVLIKRRGFQFYSIGEKLIHIGGWQV